MLGTNSNAYSLKAEAGGSNPLSCTNISMIWPLTCAPAFYKLG